MITLIASKQKNHLGLQRPVLEAQWHSWFKAEVVLFIPTAAVAPPPQVVGWKGGRMETTETLLSLAVGAECHQKKN